MGVLGGVMRSLLIAGTILLTADFIHGFYNSDHPFWYYRDDSSHYTGGKSKPVVEGHSPSTSRVSRSANNPHNIYRRQADLEVSTAMLYPHCQIWSQRNYRTFDGLTYISDGTCEVILIKIDDLFSINTINDVNCSRPETGDCTRKVKFDFLFETIDPIYLLPESEGGGAFRAGEMLTLPFYDSTLGIVIIPMNNYIVVELGHYGLSLLYDCDNYISIVALDISLIENSAQGLCGNIDGDPTNDLQHRYGETTETSSITFYTNTWIVGECIGESDMPLCTDIVSGLPLLLDPTIADRKASAEAQCDYLKDASIFGPCHSIEGLVLEEYLNACYADVCARDYEYMDGAACSSIAAYVQECSRHFGGPPGVDWRTDEICSFTCPEGLEYMACPSACNDNSCNSVLHCDIDNNMGCVEGCRCPDDQFLKDGVCTSKEECPCEHLGESIPAGGVITDDCNTCECSSGKLQCTTDICAATCTVAGDPHYRTFDNKQYNFQGECMYTLLTDCWNEWEYDTEYAIRAENAICGTRGYSCIKAVSIEYGSKTVRLGRGHAVTLDGDIISSFPHLISDIYIDVATESSSVVHLGNGVSLMWDGNTRLEIHVQPSHYNHTCGLCGTFTLNQNDDYFTAAGDTESNPQSFGNKWKYGSACQDVSITGSADSCSINTQRRALATSECSVLQSEPFTACHAKVSPATYISNCKLDVCSCKLKENCHCHMIAEYASECWRKGVAIDWRNVSSQCAIDSCEADGLRYTQCLESCQSSCAARSFSSAYLCHDVCIEGCVCPEGLIRGITGNCIQPDDCECEFEGEMFLPGESRMERCGFCTCHNGGWTCELDEDCEEATCGENQEYVACLSPCPKTCDNVNDYAGCYIDYDNCSGGCQCQGDKMLHNGKCIPISSCPCYHGGLTYQVGDSVKQTACRECTCSEDGWTCDNLEHCIGSCVAWGDPHFKTFDSRTYDFQGDCEYILTETVQGAAVAPFHIIVKSIPCGSSGVTCTKSIALTIGDPLDAETVFLVKGRDVPKTDYPFSNFRVETVGSYVFVFTSIGITLMWDKGTFLEVQIAPQYKGQVQGLCGNYDDNADNDFMTRSGGQASDDAILFSNGWKVHEYCADPPRIDDACSLNPHRRAWAYRRCNELKSDRFKNCHAKVDVAGFYDKCVYDACGCDMGGDCDCLCTAIATYAYECNKFGVPVEWRRQDVCPIQCEECERYDPCISPCDFDCALLDLGNGEGGCNYTCVEGCTCPPGQYYRDGECVQDCEVFTTTPQPTTTEISTTTEESTTSPPVTTEETTTSPPTTEETTTSPPTTEETTTSPQSTTGPPSTPPPPSTIFTTPVPSTTGTKVTSEVTSTGPPETTTSGPSSTVTTGASTTGPTTIVSGGTPKETTAPTTPTPPIFTELTTTPSPPSISNTLPPHENITGPEITPPPKGLITTMTSSPTTTTSNTTTTVPEFTSESQTTSNEAETTTLYSETTTKLTSTSTTSPPVEETTAEEVTTYPQETPSVTNSRSTTHSTAAPTSPTMTATPTTRSTETPEETTGPETTMETTKVPTETTFKTVVPTTVSTTFGHTPSVSTSTVVVTPSPTTTRGLEETTSQEEVTTSGVTLTPEVTPTQEQTTVPSTVTSPSTTNHTSICDWTQWYDDEADLNNTMSVTYERELLHELRALHTELCSEPRDIQCLVKANNVSFDETGENATCLPNVGLRCMALGEGECSDYIVRFLCCRSTIAIVTKISTVVPTLPGSTATTSVSTTSISSETPSETTCAKICNWTLWCDNEGSGKPIFQDELENKNSCKERVCENPIKIECVTSLDEVPSSFFPGVTCDVHNGLYCPSKQLGFCPDIKIRYYCCNNPCVSTNGTTTTTTIPSTPSVPTTTPTLGSTTGPTRPSSTVLTTVGTTTEETTPYSTTSVTTQPTNATTTLQTTTAETTTVTEEPCLPCEIHLLPADSYTVDGCITEPISLPTCGGSCPSSYSFKKNPNGSFSVDQSCSCCTVADSTPLQVDAMCNGAQGKVTIDHITACSCNAMTCTP